MAATRHIALGRTQPLPRSFTSSWLADEPASQGFIPLDFRSPGDRARAAEAAVSHRMPEGLHAVIAAQQHRLAPSAAREQALARLARPDAMAVVTGQQVGLFLGPLYTLHKAATAVALARRLEADTGAPCVAVFWLQTEDHDFDEIAVTHVPGRDGPVRLAPASREGISPLAPVAGRRLQPCTPELIAEVMQHLGGHPHGAEVGDLLARHYVPGATWAAAFAGTLAELFADEGLLIIDPSDPALAPFAAPVHRRAVKEAGAIAAALERRSGALAGAGLTVQVHVRPEAPLSFWHPDASEGPRYRLEPAGHDQWRLCGTEQTVSRDRVLDDLVERPERFSTSALLRPILQDSWLPTVAYVGGPGECAYFAQLAPLYEAFGRPMPLVVVRGRFTWLDATVRRLAEQLGVAPGDAARPTSELLALVRSTPEGGAPTPDALRADLLAGFDAAVDRFTPHAAELDGNLESAVRKMAGAVEAQVSRLVDRYSRTLTRRDETSQRRLQRFQGLLAPHGAPQERVYGFASFAARVGARGLIDRILAAYDPWMTEPLEVEL